MNKNEPTTLDVVTKRLFLFAGKFVSNAELTPELKGVMQIVLDVLDYGECGHDTDELFAHFDKVAEVINTCPYHLWWEARNKMVATIFRAAQMPKRLWETITEAGNEIIYAIQVETRPLEFYRLQLDANFDDIKQAANRVATGFSRLDKHAQDRLMNAVNLRSDYEPDRQRAKNPSWWRRRLRKILFLAVEMTHIRIAPTKLQLISNDARDRFKRSRQAAKDWASRTSLRNKATGKIMNAALFDPDEIDRRKYAEFMNGATGMCDLAAARNLVPYNITITLPAEWHPTRSYRQGEASHRVTNQGFNGMSPIKGHKRQLKRWGLYRSWMNKQSDLKDPLWIRAVQPHQDEAIHWHMILWLPNGHTRAQVILGKLIQYMRPDINTKDLNRVDIGVKIELLNNPVHAIQYIARSMASFTGRSGSDQKSETPEQRVEAKRVFEADGQNEHARLHGYRRFDRSRAMTTLWNIFRNIDIELVDEDARAVATAARNGNRADFWSLIEKTGIAIAYETGVNQYGETLRKVIGYRTRHGEVAFKPQWEIITERSCQGNSLIEMEPYNCTQEPRSPSPPGDPPLYCECRIAIAA